MKPKETTKMYVNVEENKDAIKKLCKTAFRSGWAINGKIKPNNLNKLSDAELEKIIKKHGNYKAQTLAFEVCLKKKTLEFSFFKTRQNNCLTTEKIIDGTIETELNVARHWLRIQKDFVGVKLDKTKRLMVIVDRNEDIINKLYGIASKKGYEVERRKRPSDPENTEESIRMFREYCEKNGIYKTKLMVLNSVPRKLIQFERIVPSAINHNKEELLDGKDDFEEITKWIETK